MIRKIHALTMLLFCTTVRPCSGQGEDWTQAPQGAQEPWQEVPRYVQSPTCTTTRVSRAFVLRGLGCHRRARRPDADVRTSLLPLRLAFRLPPAPLVSFLSLYDDLAAPSRTRTTRDLAPTSLDYLAASAFAPPSPRPLSLHPPQQAPRPPRSPPRARRSKSCLLEGPTRVCLCAVGRGRSPGWEAGCTVVWKLYQVVQSHPLRYTKFVALWRGRRAVTGGSERVFGVGRGLPKLAGLGAYCRKSSGLLVAPCCSFVEPIRSQSLLGRGDRRPLILVARAGGRAVEKRSWHRMVVWGG